MTFSKPQVTLIIRGINIAFEVKDNKIDIKKAIVHPRNLNNFQAIVFYSYYTISEIIFWFLITFLISGISCFATLKRNELKKVLYLSANCVEERDLWSSVYPILGVLVENGKFTGLNSFRNDKKKNHLESKVSQEKKTAKATYAALFFYWEINY